MSSRAIGGAGLREWQTGRSTAVQASSRPFGVLAVEHVAEEAEEVGVPRLRHGRPPLHLVGRRVLELQQLEQHERHVDARARERVVALALRGDEAGEDVGVVLAEVDEVLQAEHAHPAEVRRRVGPLEADADPVGRHALRQLHAWKAALPQPAQQLLVALVGAIVRRALERVHCANGRPERVSSRFEAPNMPLGGSSRRERRTASHPLCGCDTRRVVTS